MTGNPRALVLLLVCGLLAVLVPLVAPLSLAPEAAAAAPAPVAGTVIFDENFQGGGGAGSEGGVNRYSSFVGVGGHTYTASPDWTDGMWCNGLILSANNATQPSWASGTNKCATSTGAQSYNNLRLLASKMGEAFPPPSGGANGNYVVSSFTECPNNGVNHTGVTICANTLGTGATNGRMFDTAGSPISVVPNRYYSASVDIGATSCDTASQPRFQYQLLTTGNGTTGPINLGNVLNPCTAVNGPGVQVVSYPNTPWPYTAGIGPKDISVARLTSIGSFFAVGPQLGLRLYNNTGATYGNDSAFDNIRLIDVTPTLHKEYSPSPIMVGGTSTLTFTVVNTSEFAPKADWSFTDVMPSGVKVATGTIGGTCAQTSGTAAFVKTATVGSSTISVTGGDLASGQSSCTITVPVTSSVLGTHVNDASNFTSIVGLNPPTPAPLVVQGRLILQKNITARVVAGNQFGLNVLDGSTSLGTATTTGSTTGVQVPKVTTMAAAGTTYTVRETAAGTPTSVLTDYSSSLACVNSATGAAVMTTAATGTGINNTLVFPAGVDEVVCTYTNGPIPPGNLVVSKDASPASGTARQPGDFIDYTLRFANTGGQPVAVDYTDYLADVYDDATLVSGPTSSNANLSVATQTAPARFRITGTVPAAADYTVTYRVQVKAAGTLGDAALDNFLRKTTDPTPPATCVPASDPLCTTHPVPGALTVAKSASPTSTTAVTPGQVITYTLTFGNTGGANVAVDHTDSLAGVLDDADLVAGSLTAGSGLTATLAGDGRSFRVTGSVASGQTRTVTYQARVKLTGLGDARLDNFVRLTGTNPPATCVTTDPVCTTHPVAGSYTIAKTADPVTGTVVKPGTTITYSVTVTGTGGAVDDIVLTDALNDVLDDATFVPGSASITIVNASGAQVGPVQPVAGPTGNILTTQTFDLPIGGRAVLTYAVVVKADAWLAQVRNVVTGTTVPSGPGTPLPPSSCAPCSTTHTTPVLLRVEKVGEDSSGDWVRMDGSAWEISTDVAGAPGAVVTDPGVVAAGGGTPVAGLFEVRGLAPGTYWLSETKAPAGFQLLAEPVRFTVAADGTVTVVSGGGGLVTAAADDDDIMTITVKDVPVFAMPMAGGPGVAPWHLAGALLAALGLALGLRRRVAA